VAQNRKEIISPSKAGSLIPNGATVTISSSSALGCPDLTLKGIGEHFAEKQTPRDITFVSPIAAGDMYGVKGIDHVCQDGLISKIIAGSYPSGPSSFDPPLIRKFIADEKIDGYNLPSGVIFQMHRAGSTYQPGVFSKVGLETFIDPRLQGGALNKRTPRDLVSYRELDGQEYLFYPSIKPDVAIIRATTADEFGNLTYEHEGSPLGALDQAFAAHNNGGIVIAQVKQVVPAGSIDPKIVRVPGILVDYLVLDPDQLQTTKTFYDPALSGEHVEPEIAAPLDLTLETAIARRAAQEIQDSWIVNLGFGISAVVPQVLREIHPEFNVSWVIEQGPVGGIPLTGFAFGCAANPDAIMQSADQFTLLQGAGFNAAMLSFLEVDEVGNVNVSDLPGRVHVTAGVGGFADITSNAPIIVFSGYFTAGKKEIEIDEEGIHIIKDGEISKFVEAVSQITYSGNRGRKIKQKVMYVTERCVIELKPEGLTVTEIAPGIDLERDVLAKAKFKLLVADNLKVIDKEIYSKGAAK
jgi:acyl CoA:acetate/3-ketoacid CoA transferase